MSVSESAQTSLANVLASSGHFFALESSAVVGDSVSQNINESENLAQAASQSLDPSQCLGMVLSACGISARSEDVTLLREGKDIGRQTVFSIAHTWIIRIFELHGGYRQPASFFFSVLTDLEQAGAPSERIRHYGVIPDTPFHYTVTEFASGVELPRELCTDPSVCMQIAALYRAMRGLSIPDTVCTVEAFMQPRLAQLHAKLACASPAVSKKVGELATIFDLHRYRMVISHCDLSTGENIIVRFQPSFSITVIDWEFCSYVPEFRDGRFLCCKAGRAQWGERFIETYDPGFSPYPAKIVWTEWLCMIAEEYDGPEFEAAVLKVLDAR
ncbi:hypothetical protein B0H10DRAFT_1981511 [Mycena sp. CBHHK59/15]|nr:hypothetical protein B0H10DRAFT_1981511 [Mycena sp. CBHHK59/15]